MSPALNLSVTFPWAGHSPVGGASGREVHPGRAQPLPHRPAKGRVIRSGHSHTFGGDRGQVQRLRGELPREGRAGPGDLSDLVTWAAGHLGRPPGRLPAWRAVPWVSGSLPCAGHGAGVPRLVRVPTRIHHGAPPLAHWLFSGQTTDTSLNNQGVQGHV